MTSATEQYRKRRGGRGVYARPEIGSENSGAKSEILKPARKTGSGITARDYLLQNQVEQLISECHHTSSRSGAVVALAMLIQWRTGLRISETCALTWRDVDLQLGQLLVRNGKGGRSRVVPIHRQLAERLAIIHEYIPAGPQLIGLSTRRVTQCYADAVQLCATAMPEIASKEISSHTLRRSAAIHWLSNGVPINQVQRWLGHSSIQTTEIYLKLIADLPGMMDRVP